MVHQNCIALDKLVKNFDGSLKIFLFLQEASSPHTNGDHVSSMDIRENGSSNGDKVKMERPPSRSESSSSRSTPSLKSKDVRLRVLT